MSEEQEGYQILTGWHPDSQPSQPEMFIIPHEDMQLLTAQEVAEALKTDPSSIYKLMRTGELPAVRWGRNVRIRRADLATFILAHRVA